MTETIYPLWKKFEVDFLRQFFDLSMNRLTVAALTGTQLWRRGHVYSLSRWHFEQFCHAGQCVCTAVTPLTLTQLDDAGDDDDDEGCHLGIGEDVLHAGAPLYIGRVDECQQAWGESGVPYMFYLCMNSYSGTKSRSTYINMLQRWAWLLRTVVHTWEREAAPGSLQM